MKNDPISKAEFARRIGVSHPAVSKAIRDGRISVRADGRIDYESARQQWIKNTDPERSAVKSSKAAERPQNDTGAVSDEALTKIKAILAEQGISTDGPLTLQLARTAEVISRTSAREFEMAVARREFVPLAHVRRHVERIAIGIRQAFMNMPARVSATMASKLGCDSFELNRLLDQAIREVLNELAEPVIPADERGSGLSRAMPR